MRGRSLQAGHHVLYFFVFHIDCLTRTQWTQYKHRRGRSLQAGHHPVVQRGRGDGPLERLGMQQGIILQQGIISVKWLRKNNNNQNKETKKDHWNCWSGTSQQDNPQITNQHSYKNVNPRFTAPTERLSTLTSSQVRLCGSSTTNFVGQCLWSGRRTWNTRGCQDWGGRFFLLDI